MEKEKSYKEKKKEKIMTGFSKAPRFLRHKSQFSRKTKKKVQKTETKLRNLRLRPKALRTREESLLNRCYLNTEMRVCAQ